MKKLAVLITCLIIVLFTSVSTMAQIGYSKDILEAGNPGGDISLKTWDETWTMNAGQTLEMEIWLTDAPEPILTSGCSISYDQTLIEITDVVPYDTANGGPWDAGFTGSFLFVPGQWFIQLGNLACVAPDGDGDILLARVTFQRQAVGDVDVIVEPIPLFSTVVGCFGTEYDDQISPNTVTVTQECIVPGDCPDDGDLCTVADCDGGTCVYNPVDCDDGIDCTNDSCDALTGCINEPDDLNCDDGSVCTDDSCDPATGCVNSNNTASCDDGNACTTSDTCSGGICVGGAAPDCPPRRGGVLTGSRSARARAPPPRSPCRCAGSPGDRPGRSARQRTLARDR